MPTTNISSIVLHHVKSLDFETDWLTERADDLNLTDEVAEAIFDSVEEVIAKLMNLSDLIRNRLDD